MTKVFAWVSRHRIKVLSAVVLVVIFLECDVDFFEMIAVDEMARRSG